MTKDIKNTIEFTLGNEQNEVNPALTIPSDKDIYLCDMDGAKALVLVDLALKQVAPIFKYNCLFGIQVVIKNPTEDGFYTDEEQEVIFNIEDRAEEIFTSEVQAKYAASITMDGYRLIYFYAPSEDLLPALVGKLAAEFPEYQFNYMMEQDAHWNFYYEVLYPNPLELQLIKNRRLVQYMAMDGENLSEEREISHWFFFGNGAARSQAAVRLRAIGFEVVDDNFYQEELTENPFGLRMAKRHTLELEALNNVTYDAFEIIETFDGIYDGWDVSIGDEEVLDWGDNQE